MLREPHIAPLTDLATKLRRMHPDWEFPEFDPLDGGTNADILFLFEKPGPMTSEGGNGSGFISRNNDDRTAMATFDFMREANLPRNRTVIWNVIPGWNGTRKITTTERQAGIDALKGLIPLLSKLRTIVLVKKQAQRARPRIEKLKPDFRLSVLRLSRATSGDFRTVHPRQARSVAIASPSRLAFPH